MPRAARAKATPEQGQQQRQTRGRACASLTTSSRVRAWAMGSEESSWASTERAGPSNRIGSPWVRMRTYMVLGAPVSAVGQKEFSAGALLHASVFDIAYHAHYSAPRVTEDGTDPLADSALVGPVGTGHGLVNYDGLGRAFAVAVVQKAPFDQASPQGFEEPGSSGLIEIDVLQGAAGLWRRSLQSGCRWRRVGG